MANSLVLHPIVRSELAKTTDATTYTLNVTTGATANEDLTFPTSGTLTAGRWYWMSDDGQADASTVGGIGALVDMLVTTLDSNSEGGPITFTAALGTDGILTITASSGDFTIHWSHANTTLDAVEFGFTAADHASSSSVLVSPNTTKGHWRPGKALAVDSLPRKLYFGGVSEAPSGAYRASSFADAINTRQLEWRLITQAKTLTANVAATDPHGSWEKLWAALAAGRPCRLYVDQGATTSADYWLGRIAAEMGVSDPAEREGAARLLRWAAALDLIEVTT